MVENKRKYELKINKDLDSLTKQELEEFSEYMMSVMTEYVKEKFNISEIDLEEVNKKVKKEKAIKNVAFELAIDYENRIREITNKILKYKDRDIEEMDTVYIGNNVHNFPIKTIVGLYYKELVKSVKDNIQEINDIAFNDKNDELSIQLVEWKKEKINNIYNILNDEELKRILNNCGIKMEEEMKL